MRFAFSMCRPIPNSAKRLSFLSAKTTQLLQLSRTLYRDGYWNTLCLPFDVTISGSELSGATAMELTEASFSAGTLTLNFTSVSALEAGKPYIIKWEDPNGELADLVNPTFDAVTISKDLQPAAFSGVVTFTGSFSPVDFTANDNTKLFMRGNSTLYYPSSNVTMNSFRAYFQLDGLTAGDVAGGVKAFVLNFDDGGITTSVSDELRTNSEESRYYNISGQRIGKPSKKGLYIVNGKKVAVK